MLSIFNSRTSVDARIEVLAILAFFLLSRMFESLLTFNRKWVILMILWHMGNFFHWVTRFGFEKQLTFLETKHVGLVKMSVFISPFKQPQLAPTRNQGHHKCTFTTENIFI